MVSIPTFWVASRKTNVFEYEKYCAGTQLDCHLGHPELLSHVSLIPDWLHRMEIRVYIPLILCIIVQLVCVVSWPWRWFRESDIFIERERVGIRFSVRPEVAKSDKNATEITKLTLFVARCKPISPVIRRSWFCDAMRSITKQIFSKCRSEWSKGWFQRPWFDVEGKSFTYLVHTSCLVFPSKHDVRSRLKGKTSAQERKLGET